MTAVVLAVFMVLLILPLNVVANTDVVLATIGVGEVYEFRNLSNRSQKIRFEGNEETFGDYYIYNQNGSGGYVYRGVAIGWTRRGIGGWNEISVPTGGMLVLEIRTGSSVVARGNADDFNMAKLQTPVLYAKTITAGVTVEFLNSGGGKHNISYVTRGYPRNNIQGGDAITVHAVRADGTTTTPRNAGASSGSVSLGLGDKLIVRGNQRRSEWTLELSGSHTAFSGQPYRLTIDGQRSYPPGMGQDFTPFEEDEFEISEPFWGADLILDYINKSQGARPFKEFMRAQNLAQRATYVSTNENMQSAYYDTILWMLRNEMHHASDYVDESQRSILAALFPKLPNPLPLVGEIKSLFEWDGGFVPDSPERLTTYEVALLIELRNSALENHNMIKAIDQIMIDLTSTEEVNRMIVSLERLQYAGQEIINNKISELQKQALEQLNLFHVYKALNYYIGFDTAVRNHTAGAIDRIRAFAGIRDAVWGVWDKIMLEGASDGFTEGRLERAYDFYMFSRYLVLEQISWASIVMDEQHRLAWEQDWFIQDDWKYVIDMWNPANYFQFSQFDYIGDYNNNFMRFYPDGRVTHNRLGGSRLVSTSEGAYNINGNIITINWSGNFGGTDELILSQNGLTATMNVSGLSERLELTRGLPLQITLNNGVNVLFNGSPLSFDVPPQIINGRTMVPMRVIFEAMGATIEWNGDTQTATATKGNTVVVLQIGNTSPTVNGQVIPLDQAAIIVDGRTLAPLRFVAEAFGGTVEWDGATQTASITN